MLVVLVVVGCSDGGGSSSGSVGVTYSCCGVESCGGTDDVLEMLEVIFVIGNPFFMIAKSGGGHVLLVVVFVKHCPDSVAHGSDDNNNNVSLFSIDRT